MSTRRFLALLSSVLAVLLVAVASVHAEGERRYEVLRFAEDWSWLDESEREDAFDAVKNVPLGGDWRFGLGGSFRLRFEADENRTLGASAMADEIDDEELLRFRSFLHFEIAHGKTFRWFVEARYSDTWGEERPVSAIFRDDPDFQNFFVELTAGSSGPVPVTVRLGRQELLFGAQRLVSPLNWSSTRRTFDGLSVTVKSPRSETVVFAAGPVAHEVHDIDTPVDEQLFWGVHAVLRPASGHRVELYGYVQDDPRDIYLNEVGTKSGELERRTLGARYLFTREGWKVDLEGALQSGDLADDDLSAFMGSATFGYQWREAAWKPALEIGFDVASGDSDAGDGDRGTFNQLYPLGHAYFGHLDLVGRQNVEAYRVQLALSPCSDLKWVSSLHSFHLEDDRDALYNAGGAPIRRDPTGAAGSEVATELDTLVSWSFRRHHAVSVELTKWWSGSFLEETGSGRDAWFAWAGYEFRF